MIINQQGGLRLNNIFKQNQHNLPLFSIITIVFNDKNHIEETILSVLKQTYQNIEYIVIDGGSTDGTVDIIRKYNDSIDYWVSEYDGGIYPAMNKGLLISNGIIINMMNSGDYYYDDTTVEKVAKYFIDQYDLSVVLGKSKYINTDGSDFLLRGNNVLSTLKAGRFNTISHQAFFYKKTLHDEFGLYNEYFRICADGHFMYRVYYSKEHSKELIDEILSLTRTEGISGTPESLLEHKIFYDEVFGRSLLNELLYIKYLLKKSKTGKFLFNKYLGLKNSLFRR